MKLKFIATAALAAITSVPALAGGYLTNTNQSISFLRNPARDAAIGIDGVYSNPAGVAFLENGFHLGFNWQAAFQTRTVETTNPLFQTGVHNDGALSKTYKGKATAPFIPSLHAAYNKNKWSFQFGFGVIGGGGKCTFDQGLGSFEGAVAQIGAGLAPLGAKGYDAGYYLRGSQFFYGFTLGATYKPIKNLSVYLGVRSIYASTSYKASVSDIKVNTDGGMVDFGKFLDGIQGNYASLEAAMPTIQAGIAQLEPAVNGGTATAEQMATYKELMTKAGQYQALSAKQEDLKNLEVYREGINLQCNQKGFGIAPIIGVDYKVGNFNFAAKYEFKTHIGLKNESTLKQAMAIEAVNQFKDGQTVNEDMPALLTVGAQWSVVPSVRINAGYHLYFDKQAKKYADKQNLLSKNSMEYLGGVEWEPVKKLTISAGVQVTRYGNTDEYMSDMSFAVNSWSFGVGAKYQFNKHIAAQAAYFQTNYDHYKTEANAAGIINDFTRSNRVVGAGIELSF